MSACLAGFSSLLSLLPECHGFKLHTFIASTLPTELALQPFFFLLFEMPRVFCLQPHYHLYFSLAIKFQSCPDSLLLSLHSSLTHSYLYLVVYVLCFSWDSSLCYSPLKPFSKHFTQKSFFMIIWLKVIYPIQHGICFLILYISCGFYATVICVYCCWYLSP